jgi:hypothetical protein
MENVRSRSTNVKGARSLVIAPLPPWIDSIWTGPDVETLSKWPERKLVIQDVLTCGESGGQGSRVALARGRGSDLVVGGRHETPHPMSCKLSTTSEATDLVLVNNPHLAVITEKSINRSIDCPYDPPHFSRCDSTWLAFG